MILLQQLMLNIQVVDNLERTPCPAEVFDLIGGTSTGGLVALLVGRLGLSAEEALLEYASLAGRVFSERKAKGQDGTFKATNLEEAVKDVIKRKGGPGRQPGGDPNLALLDPANGHGTCRM